MQLLRIGSIVLLKGGNKKLMIYGKNQIRDKDSKEYDYLACLFPEGNLSSELNVFFNHGDIEKIFYNGYNG